MPSIASSGPASKKRKRPIQNSASRKKTIVSNERAEDFKNDDAGIEVAAGVNEAIAHMDRQLLSDYIAQKTKSFEKDLSAIELEDKYIPQTAFQDSTTWTKPRTLENLPGYLELCCSKTDHGKGLAWASAEKGQPHTIVITGAGLRAAELTRALRQFRTPEAPVAKLFAKHIKFKEAEQFVKSSRIGIAVGTPTRVVDLINSGALSLESLVRIVVDGSYVDQKKRSIFDMRETFLPMLKLLNWPSLKSHYGASEDPLTLVIY